MGYAETSMCRRKYLLHYFGEEMDGDTCGNCDNCLDPKKPFDATDALGLLLEAVAESKERHRAKFICDLLTGTQSSEVKTYKGSGMASYGKGQRARQPLLDGRAAAGPGERLPEQGHRELRQHRHHGAGRSS